MTKKEAASQVCAAKARLGVTWAQLAAGEARNQRLWFSITGR